MKDQLAICIIAHNAYGVLAGVDTGHAGGIEVQTPLMARWFAAQGHKVSMITWDEGINDDGVIDGVEVFKLCKRDAGLRVVRFFHPRWTSFTNALSNADADIYYYNCGDLGLGQLALWAKYRNKKFVYSVASEKDCYQDLSHLTSIRDRVMYKYGLRRADKIITQTNKQRSVLTSEYGLESTMIPMPSKGFSECMVQPEERLARKDKRILWIGRINKEKRLEWLLDVAERCPDMIFDIVGAENEPSQYASDLMLRAKMLKNVIMHGRVPHNKIGEFYKNAFLMCSTSVYEGFPNIYLEAWSTGLPLVSTFDPDSLIEKHGIGEICNDVPSIVESFSVLREKSNYEKASKAASSYYAKNHTLDSSMHRFEKLFKEIS